MSRDNQNSIPSVVGYFIEKNLKLTMQRILEESGFFEEVTAKRILVKPNWGFPYRHPGACTSFKALFAFLSVVHQRFEEIILIESDQVLVDIEKAASLHGRDSLLQSFPNVKWINLSKEPMIQVQTSLSTVPTITLPALLKELPLVTFPVMKTHGRSTVSLSLKNQWGCLEKQRHNFHPYLEDVIAEINLQVQPVFAVLDGLIGLEGDGPKTGKPFPSYLLMASSDLVALDAATATLMGFSPNNIPHIQIAAQRGLGSLTYRFKGGVAGCKFRFKKGKNNLVAIVEMALRKFPFSSALFEGVIFHLLCLGAAGYYRVWDILRQRQDASYWLAKIGEEDCWQR